MILYLDSSALVKRYVEEEGSTRVRSAMADAESWFTCRISFVEIWRALELRAGRSAATTFASEWETLRVLEVDQALVERAGAYASARRLRSLDALHLAAAMLLPRERSMLATWDRRLHAAARREGLAVLPEALS